MAKSFKLRAKSFCYNKIIDRKLKKLGFFETYLNFFNSIHGHWILGKDDVLRIYNYILKYKPSNILELGGDWCFDSNDCFNIKQVAY